MNTRMQIFQMYVFFSCLVDLLLLLLFLIFIYFLFLTALGLRCCAQAFSSCSERGLLFAEVRRLLIVVASLAVEHRL